MTMLVHSTQTLKRLDFHLKYPNLKIKILKQAKVRVMVRALLLATLLVKALFRTKIQVLRVLKGLG